MDRKILVADDEPAIRRVLGRALAAHHYGVLDAEDGTQALELASRERPSLILLDVDMPRKDGWAVVRELRASHENRLTPVIMLTGQGKLLDKVVGFAAGADDYVTKPFLIQELVARIESLLKRSERNLSANPLTRLPGSPSVEIEVNRRILLGLPFAFCYADIDHFKSYNDVYGYLRGDQLIRGTAEILLQSVQAFGSADDLLGHVGGDDFVVVTQADRAEAVAGEAVRRFDRRAASWYSHADAARGFVVASDRQGVERRFPLVSLSVAIASSRNRRLEHYARAVEIASEIKRYLKSAPGRTGSAFLTDRRSGPTTSA